MLGTPGTYESYLNRRDRLAEQYDSIVTCETPQRELKAGTIPVSVGIALFNLWAWVDPITPHEQQLARNGGYFQTSLAVQRGTWK